MDHDPLAERLLRAIEQVHVALAREADAGCASRAGLRAVRDALSASLAGMSEAAIRAVPSDGEWSMLQVMDHLLTHDSRYTQPDRPTLDHYITHGIEHALQLWRLRQRVAPRTMSLPSAVAGDRRDSSLDAV